MVAATNKTGTSILAFEYVQLKEPFDFASHENAPASISGRIEAIVPNPNKSRGLVMRFYISDATIILRENPPKKRISADGAGQLTTDGALAFFSRKHFLSANPDRAPQL